MKKKRIFISHISSEAELAENLKQHLQKDFLGLLDIFVSSDRETIQAGRKWLEEVDKALKSADMQIVLCSKESVGRPWVNFEAGAVWLRGIPVIPLCHSGLGPNDLPVPLGMLEGIECGRPEGLEKLYDAIAAKLGLDVPDVDFHKMADELGELEKKYIQAREGPDVIENPHILCAASEGHARFGFHLDVEVLERYFPKRVEVEAKLTAKKLRWLLTNQHFDIVHLVLWVDAATGALLFDPTNLTTQKAVASQPDAMSAEGFAKLLIESKTKLVVLATCHASLLAYKVSEVANMAATDVDVTAEAAAEWEDCFYGLLAQGKSLYKAFDITESQSSVPIRAIRHQDVVFVLSDS